MPSQTELMFKILLCQVIDLGKENVEFPQLERSQRTQLLTQTPEGLCGDERTCWKDNYLCSISMQTDGTCHKRHLTIPMVFSKKIPNGLSGHKKQEIRNYNHSHFRICLIVVIFRSSYVLVSVIKGFP